MKQLGTLSCGLAAAIALLFSTTTYANNEALIDPAAGDELELMEPTDDFAMDPALDPLLEPAPQKTVLVKCESIDKKYRRCGVNAKIKNVRLHEQLSNTDCKKNKNWGFDNNSIWVDNGCRGIFAVVLKQGGGGNQPAYQDIHCGSVGGNYRTCGTQLHGIYDMIVLQKLSGAKCLKNYSFGFSYDRIWVDNGCEAIFRVYGQH